MANSLITEVGKFHEVLKYYNVNGYSQDLYLFLGKSSNWDDVNADGIINNEDVPLLTGSKNEDKEIRKNIIVLQKLSQTNVSPVIARSDWKKDNVFSCEINPIEGKYDYVRTSADQIFKCIWNNNGGESTVEPQLDTTDTNIHDARLYPDGYVWIYITTIDVGAKYQFFDNDWMPIQPYSLLDDIDSDSIGLGQIEYIVVTDGGSGYDEVPKVTINGDGNSDALAYATIRNGSVSGIVVVNKGTDYTYADIKISAPQEYGGRNATAKAYISSIGGTASNPCIELGCTHVSIDVILEAQNDEIPTNTMFTQIGLISKPKKMVNGKSYYPSELDDNSSSTIKAYSLIKYVKTASNTEIINGSKVVQRDIDGVIFSGDVIYDDMENCELYLINTFGTPDIGGVITTVDSFTDGIMKIVSSFTGQDFAKHAGNIIYVENRVRTKHTKAGNEQFRITISFS